MHLVSLQDVYSFLTSRSGCLIISWDSSAVLRTIQVADLFWCTDVSPWGSRKHCYLRKYMCVFSIIFLGMYILNIVFKYLNILCLLSILMFAFASYLIRNKFMTLSHIFTMYLFFLWSRLHNQRLLFQQIKIHVDDKYTAICCYSYNKEINLWVMKSNLKIVFAHKLQQATLQIHVYFWA